MGRILVRLDLLPSLRGIPWVPHRQRHGDAFAQATVAMAEHGDRAGVELCRGAPRVPGGAQQPQRCELQSSAGTEGRVLVRGKRGDTTGCVVTAVVDAHD